MSRVIAITKKELKTYFNSPIAYIFMVVFLVLSGFLFFRNFFIVGQVTMRNYFSFLPWLFLFFVPAVTMRLWSEEKKLDTIEVLLTFPVKDWEAVLGKFIASLVFLAVTLFFTLSIPLSLTHLGNLDWGIVAASYIGTLFLASAYLAIGLWVSSLASNQIVSFIVTVVLVFVLFMLGEGLVLLVIPQALVSVLDYLGLNTHYESIARGVLDSRDVVYYLSVIIFFLYLNVRSLGRRHTP